MSRPSGKRTTNITLFMSPTEARIADLARLLDGQDGKPLPRSTWVLDRAKERLQAHAEGGQREAAAALVALTLHYHLMGTPAAGRRPASVRPMSVALSLEALRDLAQRRGDAEAEAQATAALEALQAPAAPAAHNVMEPAAMREDIRAGRTFEHRDVRWGDGRPRLYRVLVVDQKGVRFAALTASGRPVHREHVEGADVFLAAHLGCWTAEPAQDAPGGAQRVRGGSEAAKAGKRGAAGDLDGGGRHG